MNRYSEPKKDDAYLEHYGVKGMRWGVRRARSIESSSRSKPSRKDVAKNDREEKAGKAKRTLSLKPETKRNIKYVAIPIAAAIGTTAAYAGFTWVDDNKATLRSNYKQTVKNSQDTILLGASILGDFNRSRASKGGYAKVKREKGGGKVYNVYSG